MTTADQLVHEAQQNNLMDDASEIIRELTADRLRQLRAQLDRELEVRDTWIEQIRVRSRPARSW